MHRDHHLGLDPSIQGKRSILRVHREVATDWHQYQIRLVTLADELHVTKQARVTHVPDLETIFEFDDITHRFARWVRLIFACCWIVPDD